MTEEAGVVALLPRTFDDGLGNHIAFSEKGPGVLRVEDNIGGFAEINWNGDVPILVDSRALPRTASARGPTLAAIHIAAGGEIVLLFAPFVAWMLLTMALVQLEALSTKSPSASLLLQSIAMVIYVIALLMSLKSPDGPNGVGRGMFVGFVLVAPALLMSLIGLLMMSWCLMRSALE